MSVLTSSGLFALFDFFDYWIFSVLAWPFSLFIDVLFGYWIFAVLVQRSWLQLSGYVAVTDYYF